MGNEGGVAGRPVVNNRRYGVAPSLSFGLGTPTRLIISGLNQQADDIPDYGIPWLFNSPAPVSRHNYYGFDNGGNYLRTRDNIATVRFEHDFGSHFTLRNQSRYARYDRDVRITEPQAILTTTPGVTPSLKRRSRPSSSTATSSPPTASRVSWQIRPISARISRLASSSTMLSAASNSTAKIPTLFGPNSRTFRPPAC